MRKSARSQRAGVHSTVAPDAISLADAAIEGSTDAVFAKDLDGRYVFVNPAAARFFGRDAEEILGRLDEELFPAASAAESRANDRRALESGTTETYESETTCNGVTVCHLSTKFPYRNALGEVAGVIGFARDVTAKRDAEDALRKHLELFEALVEAQGDLGVALVVCHGPELKPRFSNDALLEITGHSRQEVEQLPSLMELLAPDQRARVESRRQGQPASDRQVQQYDTVMLDKSGARREIELATKPLGENDHVVMLRDVTLERRARAQLMASDRLSAVGRLAAGVAHEINNPMAYVVTSLAEIREIVDELSAAGIGGAPSGEADGRRRLGEAIGRLRAATDDACDGADRVTTIVREVGMFSRAPDESISSFDVQDAVRSSVRLTNNTVRHRARLELELGATPLVRGNEARLAQVLVNLLMNAAQAIPDDRTDQGVIRLRTSLDESGRAVIEVIDNGVGISAENVRHIFEPFFTTKPPGSGTGLGLSVCVGIARGMGWELTVATQPGCGSTFRVVLPAAPDEPLPAPLSSLRATKRRRGADGS